MLHHKLLIMWHDDLNRRLLLGNGSVKMVPQPRIKRVTKEELLSHC
jgi:hypothetical protein